MQFPGTRKPNIKALRRREDVDGLVAAASFQDVLPDRHGRVVDLGVSVREHAILALGSSGPEAGNGTVAGALSDPADRVRVAAIRVLHAREEAKVLAEAIAWLPAYAGHSRRMALQAIAELNQPTSASVLASSLVRSPGDDPLPDEEVSLLFSLIGAASSSDVVNAVVEEMLAALMDEEDVVADRAEELLADLAPASVEGVIAELNTGRAAHRAAAVLGRMRDTRGMEPLVDALAHRDVRVRAASAAALGELRDPAAVDALMRATQDPDHLVRARAGWALDHLGAVAIVVGVSHLMRPMIHDAVTSAIESHRHLTEESKPALPGGTESDDNGSAAANGAASGGDETRVADPAPLRRLEQVLDRLEDARGGNGPPPTA